MRFVVRAGEFDSSGWMRATRVRPVGSEDFEDALQFYSALHAEADCLITRDADHFPSEDLPVLAPAAFLASLNPE